jgi:hypothetical protein
MPAHGSIFGATVYVAYTANEQNANLFTKAGSPSRAVHIICTINAGVILSSSDNSLPSFTTTSSFAAGSTLLLINLGAVHGRGGPGGNGGNVPSGGLGLGSAGGDAFETHVPTTINNATGELFGGGAGGAGGAGGSVATGPGGGGGQGEGTAAGGLHGSGGLSNSGNGTNGNASGPGTAGAVAGDASAGQDGATWGNSKTRPGGNAVRIGTGGSVTFTSGNDSAHVKGNVGA